MDKSFTAQRITELRCAKNSSAYRLSLELGLGKGYIQGIISGEYQLFFKQRLNIEAFFNMILLEFFERAFIIRRKSGKLCRFSGRYRMKIFGLYMNWCCAKSNE